MADANPAPDSRYFISYTSTDRQWAEWIAWQLENAGHEVALQAWDFRPGQNFVLRMQEETSRASHTLLLLSPEYLNSLYTQPEWAAAFANDPTGAGRTLVPVRVRECEPSGMLGQLIYIDIVGLDEAAARTALFQGLLPDGRPSQPPLFPAGSASSGRPVNSPFFPGDSAEVAEASTPGPLVSAEVQPLLSVDQIQVSSAAIADCERLGLSWRELRSFVVTEAGKHKLLFAAPFSSLSLLFEGNHLLLSWDGVEARLERLLRPQEANPTMDSWQDVLEIYRRATGLPYRLDSPDRLMFRPEARRTIRTFSQLVEALGRFLEAVKEHRERTYQGTIPVGASLERARLALEEGEMRVAVPLLETLLSISHKVLLELAPQGTPEDVPESTIPSRQFTEDSTGRQLTVLLVDDDEMSLKTMNQVVREAWGDDSRVINCHDIASALRVLVEETVDVLVTDLLFPHAPGSPLIEGTSVMGVELLEAAKKASPGVETIVWSNYAGQMLHLEARAGLVDHYLPKTITIDETILLLATTATGRRLIRQEEADQDG